MTPLRITAHLRGAVMIGGRGIAIDGMLAWAEAQRLGLPPLLDGTDAPDVPIPVEKEARGRFHLASFAIGTPEQRENRYTNRRFPVAEAQMFGDAKIRRLNISTGPTKSYRIPRETIHFKDDRLDWYAIGDADAIRSLLASINYVGKKRAVGCGAVDRWTVETCETWDGFPVVRDGAALRPLPLDWPGLVDPEPGLMPLTFPYWLHARAEAVAMPAGVV